MPPSWADHLTDMGDGTCRIERHGAMLTSARIVADADELRSTADPAGVQQIVNSACLPGIVGEAWAMADWHVGYGFPIGAVVATDAASGTISPGGVGFDINCGVRAVRYDVPLSALGDLDALARRFSGRIPAGPRGRGGIPISEADLEDVLERGASAVIDRGYGRAEDLEHIEWNGGMAADAGHVSARARARGMRTLGTVGTGNHFIELQIVDRLVDRDACERHGIEMGTVLAMIHSGSRGVGHQICTDSVTLIESEYDESEHGWTSSRWGMKVPDRQLACAPIGSEIGQAYLQGMQAAANFGFANRTVLHHRLDAALEAVAGAPIDRKVLWDVGHNIATFEIHPIDGIDHLLCVHRKGATRIHRRGAGEHAPPIPIPGDMGRASWLALEPEEGPMLAFGSGSHGAGRIMSRKHARDTIDVSALRPTLREGGVHLAPTPDRALSEEAPEVYKDVDEVMHASETAGLLKPMCRVRPKVVVKG